MPKIVFRKIKGRIIPILSGPKGETPIFVPKHQTRNVIEVGQKAETVQNKRSVLKKYSEHFSSKEKGTIFSEAKRIGKEAGSRFGAILRIIKKRVRK